MTEKKSPLFRDLDASEDVETTEIESLCMNCEKNFAKHTETLSSCHTDSVGFSRNLGVTRLLLSKIPMFHEVVIMSFYCPHCHTRNNEIQRGAPVQDRGVMYTLSVQDSDYLNRLVVKGDSAVVRIPELDFEIPSNTQKGTITTVESLLSQAKTDLEKDQPVRKVLQPELAEKLEKFIVKLKECRELKQPFSMVLDDPTGNSFIENTFAPESDPHLVCVHYDRTESQNSELGTSVPNTPLQQTESDTTGEKEDTIVSQEEVLTFPTNCSSCHAPTDVRMKLIDIPHFRQVVVMATTCEYCGSRSNEVKAGTGVSEYGTKITLHLTDRSDLSRDILKAETAMICIPELDFEVQSGTLGGRFTTIEGILTQIKDQLKASNPLSSGDSSSGSQLDAFLDKLDQIITGQRLNVHLVLDDPAGNSYVQNVYAPDPDPEMKVEHYQRSFEQNEILGLNDMKTENYEITGCTNDSAEHV